MNNYAKRAKICCPSLAKNSFPFCKFVQEIWSFLCQNHKRLGVRRGKCIFEFIYFYSCKSKSKDPTGCLLLYYLRLFISLKKHPPPLVSYYSFLIEKLEKLGTGVWFTQIFYTNTLSAFLYKHTLPAFPNIHISCLSIQTHFLPFHKNTPSVYHTNTLPVVPYKHISCRSIQTHFLSFHKPYTVHTQSFHPNQHFLSFDTNTHFPSFHTTHTAFLSIKTCSKYFTPEWFF